MPIFVLVEGLCVYFLTYGMQVIKVTKASSIVKCLQLEKKEVVDQVIKSSIFAFLSCELRVGSVVVEFCSHIAIVSRSIF